MCSTPRFPEFREDREPELHPLRLAHPQPQQLLVALEVQGSGRGRPRASAHGPGTAPSRRRAQIHDRVHRIQRPAMPRPDVVQNRIGHRRDQRRRDLDLVQLLQVILDLVRPSCPAHTARSPSRRTRPAPLPLPDLLRVEPRIAVPRHFDVKLPRVRFHPPSVGGRCASCRRCRPPSRASRSPDAR